jgi:hypothetical protein
MGEDRYIDMGAGRATGAETERQLEWERHGPAWVWRQQEQWGAWESPSGWATQQWQRVPLYKGEGRISSSRRNTGWTESQVAREDHIGGDASEYDADTRQWTRPAGFSPWEGESRHTVRVNGHRYGGRGQANQWQELHRCDATNEERGEEWTPAPGILDNAGFGHGRHDDSEAGKGSAVKSSNAHSSVHNAATHPLPCTHRPSPRRYGMEAHLHPRQSAAPGTVPHHSSSQLRSASPIPLPIPSPSQSLSLHTTPSSSLPQPAEFPIRITVSSPSVPQPNSATQRAAGLLRTRSVVQDLEYVDIDYCQFSTLGFQKPTRFWCCAEIARQCVTM